MKNVIRLLLVFTITLGIASCNTEDSDDWAGAIAGLYTNTASNTEITVNKIDDKTVSIAIVTGSGSGALSVAFSSVTLNSETAFTLNEVSQNGAVCNGTETFNGTGTASNGNISVFMTVEREGDGGIYNQCTGTDTRNVSASM
jgi:hypothetical protein